MEVEGDSTGTVSVEKRLLLGIGCGFGFDLVVEILWGRILLVDCIFLIPNFGVYSL